MRPYGIDQLRTLVHQKIAGAMLHQMGLLFDRLHLNETHGRPAHRLANRFGICRIVLVALDVGLYVLRWHQPHIMTELGEFSGPMVRRGAGLQPNEARRQLLKKSYDLTAPQLLADDDLFLRINAVNLKHVLGDIQPDRSNLHLDGSLM